MTMNKQEDLTIQERVEFAERAGFPKEAIAQLLGFSTFQGLNKELEKEKLTKDGTLFTRTAAIEFCKTIDPGFSESKFMQATKFGILTHDEEYSKNSRRYYRKEDLECVAHFWKADKLTIFKTFEKQFKEN